ncbi:MAG: hypothetical protein OXB84_01080 [Halobacteriovoraceae bacterium]|nr:hypothetical protein [Halobacteriovoraceae bacterium]
MKREEKKFLRDLGLRLRRIREKKGWTLEYTEEQGYPAWQHLQRVESGAKRVEILTLRRLSIVYNVSLKEILGEW